LEKGLWENGMNVACGMEMSISLKLCGAEVYVCNEGEMKCWYGRGTKPTGTNVAGMERIYRKHIDKSTRNVFIFLQQLMGGGEFSGIECCKVGNKFYVFGTITFWNGCRKIILTFQHSQLLSQSIFGMEWGRQKTPEMAKMFCGCCPHILKTFCVF
jgi:hypothetical protein